MEGLLELIAAIPVLLDGTVFNLTLKLTDLGVFPYGRQSYSGHLKGDFGLWDTWINHTLNCE